MAAYTIIGHPSQRVEGTDEVPGTARYTADVSLPGTLWGRALRSPFPHARMTHIDTSQAQYVPGVHAILTGADMRGIRYGRRLYDVPALAEDRAIGGDYGARGIGENPLGPTAPAISNAVADAVGVRIYDLPMTAEKVYQAMSEAS